MQRRIQESASYRALIIDDDEGMRSLLTELLEEDGFKAESADNGYDALREIARKQYDLIITDVEMTGLSGLDILPEMKKLRPDASIIVMTSFAQGDMRRRSLEKGAGAYLEKPIRTGELRGLIHKMLSTKKHARASPGSP